MTKNILKYYFFKIMSRLKIKIESNRDTIFWAENRMNRPIASAKDLSILCPNLMLRTKKTQKTPKDKLKKPLNKNPATKKPQQNLKL